MKLILLLAVLAPLACGGREIAQESDPCPTERCPGAAGVGFTGHGTQETIIVCWCKPNSALFTHPNVCADDIAQAWLASPASEGCR